MFGRPLISAIGSLKRSRPLPATAHRVSVIQPTAIGDTLLGSGLVAAIHFRYPGVKIEFLHGPSNAEAFHVIDGEFSTRLVSFARPWDALAVLRRTSADVVVDLTPWSRTTAICAMLSGAISVGYDSTAQGRARAFDIAVPHRSDRHELDNIEALSHVFTPGRRYEMRLRQHYPAPAAALPWRQLILCHAGAGGSRGAAKSWPVRCWVELTRLLVQDGFVVGFTGTDKDAELVSAILSEAGGRTERAVSLCGKLRLGELAYVLQKSRALISVDTAPAHLAAGLGTPVLTLHGPTRSWRWGPRSEKAAYVDSQHPDAGYISFGFEDHPSANNIMTQIDVETVHRELRRLLESTEQRGLLST
jgi:ADP-heptose:LPS heptosyltransferase